MTRPVTIRYAGQTLRLTRRPIGPISITVDDVRVTIEPVDPNLAPDAASGAGGTSCDDILRQMGSA